MTDELLKEIAVALESLDGDRLTRHYAEDAVFEDPAAGQVVHGHDQLATYFATLFSLPAVQFEVVSIFGAGEAAAAEWVWRGVSRESRESFAIRGASIFQLRGGKIQRETIYYDPATWLA